MPAEMVNYQSTEVLTRRLYGIEKAFELVRKEADWKAPRGAAKSWKSKVQYHLLEEIDLRPLMSNSTAVPAVDAEVTARLKEKALLIKAIEKSGATDSQAKDD